MYNTFMINEKKYLIKQLTIEEQKELLNINIEEVANDKEMFLNFTKKYIINKTITFDFFELENEREDIITAIVKESDINKYGDFDIMKTFDKIEEEVGSFIFILYKFLKDNGYNYKELKSFTQQELVETCVYEIMLKGIREEAIYFLTEANKFFNNKRIIDLINEFNKMENNKPQIKTESNIDNGVKSGLSGLMSLK